MGIDSVSKPDYSLGSHRQSNAQRLSNSSAKCFYNFFDLIRLSICKERVTVTDLNLC